MIQLISDLVILQYLDDSFTLERATKYDVTINSTPSTTPSTSTYSSFDLDGIVLGQLGVSIELVLVVVVVVIMMVVSVVVAVILAAMLVIAVVVVTLILVAIVVVVVRFAAGIG